MNKRAGSNPAGRRATSGSVVRVRAVQLATAACTLLLGNVRVVHALEHGKVAPFAVGERLTYHVHYMGAPAGRAVIEVAGIVPIGSRKAYHLIARARSSKLFSVFYPVNDRVDSLVDTETLLPVRFEKHLREGREYTNDEVTLFDHARKLARNWNLTGTRGRDWGEMELVRPSWNDEGANETGIPDGVQDALASFYYLRRHELVVGQKFVVPVNADEKNYRVEVDVLRREKLSRGGRGVDTIVTRPILKQVKLGGILKEKGDVTVWLTDDDCRVPLAIQGRVVIGYITLSLVEIGGPGA